MADLRDRIARLAEEAQSRVDVAAAQAAWQEGRAHGLREASVILASNTETRITDDAALAAELATYLAKLQSQERAAADRYCSLNPEDSEADWRRGCAHGIYRALAQVTAVLEDMLFRHEGGGDV